MSAAERRPARTSVTYAWIPLVLVTLVILLIVSGGEEGPVAEGSVLHAFTTPPLFTDEAPDSIIELRLQGTLLLGMVVFGLAVILRGSRRGERWAWYVLWYYPIFFVLHVIAFGTFIIDGVFFLICALSLLIPYRKFFPREQATSRARQTSLQD
jgi:uncharacterized membrane protein